MKPFRTPRKGSPEDRFFQSFIKHLKHSREAMRVWTTDNCFKPKWTGIALKALRRACTDMERGVAVTSKGRRGPGRKEYLAIDLVAWKGWGRPKIIAEHENCLETWKIRYCAWKLLCVDAGMRVLVAYVSPSNRIKRSARSADALCRKALSRVLSEHQKKTLLVLLGNWDLTEVPRPRDWSKVFSAHVGGG